MDKAKIISIVNQKGGVGKTTTCINLPAALSAVNDNKILVIDLDPQGNASTGLGLKRVDREHNIYDILCGKIDIKSAIKPTALPNLHIIPSILDLAAAEFELQKFNSWHFILKNSLAEIAHNYSYIFIDCPPSLGLLTINSLVASHGVIIPLQCEFFALEGLSHLLDTVQKVKMHLNPQLQIDGVLLTMYDKRNNLSKHIEKDVRDNLGEIVYKTIIGRNVTLPEASSHGKPALLYNVNCSGAKAYMDLANEINTKLIQLKETV